MKLLILNILKLFSFEKKTELYKMYSYVLLLTVLEALGIALILPAILIITQADQSNNFFLIFENAANYFNFNNTIVFFLIFFLFVYLIKFLLSVYCIFYQYNFAFNFYKNITAKIYKNYLAKNFLQHLNLKSADMIRKISSDIDQVTLNSVLPLFSLVTELTIIIGIIIFLLFLNLKLTIFVFLATLSLIALYFLLSKKRTDYWAQIRLVNYTSRINLMQQSFMTINEIKILSAEKFMEKKFDEYNIKSAQAYKYQATLIDSNKFFVEVAGITMFILLILIFIDKVEANFIGLISVYAAAAFRFLPSINRILTASQKIRFAAPSVNKILEEIEVLNRTKNLDEKKVQKNLNFNEKLELKNIYFHFSEKNKIIQNLNLVINKYDKIGIKGPSGSGKSTLLYLISGLISPQNGEIFIDNKLTNISDQSWYKKIGYVPQFINLIDDTIKENIIYGLDIDNQEIINKKINEISKVCLLDEFIDKTNDKFETIVGENGLKISGGQKQRIGIARSIFRNPELLILDESTSSLDSEAENQLLKNLFSYGSKKTLVIASHKDTTLNYCDKIFSFENHKLKQLK